MNQTDVMAKEDFLGEQFLNLDNPQLSIGYLKGKVPRSSIETIHCQNGSLRMKPGEVRQSQLTEAVEKLGQIKFVQDTSPIGTWIVKTLPNTNWGNYI